MKFLLTLFFLASFQVSATESLSIGCFTYDQEGYMVNAPLKKGKAPIILENITAQNGVEDNTKGETADGEPLYIGVTAVLSKSGKTILFMPSELNAKSIRFKTKRRVFVIEAENFILECTRLKS
jgi:hypothetical protein